ncbi:MAG: HlyD family secretion protein [Rhodobacteraceae bacterium]|nr:HlyD family secretion protein [Paracoccaceae bacterium]
MNAQSSNFAQTMTASAEQVKAPPRRKRWRRILLMLALPLALALGGGYVWLTAGRYESTENANLQLARVAISAEVGGRIVNVDIKDSEPVKGGAAMFRVDPEPYRIALEQADATLSAARLNVEQLKAAYGSAIAKAKVAADDVAYYQTDYDRQKALNTKGFVAASVLDDAARALHNAEESKIAADQAVQSAKAALAGNPEAPVDAHPMVQEAQATRDRAAYDLDRTVVTAPADGIVAEAGSFRTGQYVTAGSPLFVLVETGETWIEANFKETQLTHMAAGQSAKVEFDTYPGRDFDATVQAIGAGTGAEFSVLPAQNATGNWVKVTQRVPVRLTLDESETAGINVTGMSAKVTVDTGARSKLPAFIANAATALAGN